MSRKLFVGNLPYSVTSERLSEAFSQFGTVTSSKVIVDRESGRSRGFAFLEMETDDQGAAAMQAMNGALLDGRSIAVREAVERQREPERGEKGRIAPKECDGAIHDPSPSSASRQAAVFQCGSSVMCGGHSATGPTGKPASSLAKPWFTSRWCASSARTTRTTSRKVALTGSPQ